MIRVRRRDFVSGSHSVPGFQGIAEPFGQGVTVYLLPGLTGRQRRAVIRRLRWEASRGCGPALPLAQLIIALLLDRLRGAIGLAAGAVWLHPRTTLAPLAFVTGLLTLFVLASAGVGSGPAGRPAFAAGQSGAEVRSAGGHASGSGRKLGSVGDDPRVTATGGAGAVGIRPSSIGPGGRGLGSGQPARTGPRSTGRPRAARVCFGAMPGVSAKRSSLSCHRTSS